MKISRIVYSNINELYEIFLEAKKTSEISMTDTIPKIYNHVILSIYIEDASLLETYVIGNMCDGMITGIHTSNIFKILTGFDDMGKCYQSIDAATITMEQDDSIVNKPREMLFPIGCIRKDLVVSFSGDDMVKLIGVMMGELFSALFKNKKTDKLKGELGEIKYPESLPMNDPDFCEKLNNYFIHCFRDHMYKTFNKLIINSDTSYESFMENNYYQYLDNKMSLDVCLAHYTSTSGTINFLSSRYTPSDQINALKDTNAELKDLNIQGKDYITFAIRSSIYTFLEISGLIDNTEHESFTKPLYNLSLMAPGYLKRYDARVMRKVREMLETKINIANSDNNDYFKYEMITAMDKINFIIKLPVEVAKRLSLPHGKTMMNHDGDNTLLNYELDEISKKISDLTQKVISLIE